MKHLAIAAIALASSLVSAGCVSAQYSRYDRERFSRADTLDLMTKDEVIVLTKAKVSDDVIISQMKASGSYFHLNTQDVVDMVPDNLYIIMVVNDKRRTSAWQYNGDGFLSGTVDDYHFRIGGYYLDEFSRAKRANIFCPYAIGFNAKESQQKVLMRGASAHQRWLRSKA